MTRKIYHFRSFVPALWLAISVVAATSISAQFIEIPTQTDQIAKAQQLFNAGNELMSKGNTQQAVQKYSEAIAAAPSFPAPYLNRGLAYISISKSSEALADADKALSLLATGSHPPSYAAISYQVKGMVYQNQGDHKLAAEFFSKIDRTRAFERQILEQPRHSQFADEGVCSSPQRL